MDDYVSFLINKFRNDLQEADQEWQGRGLPLHDELKAIETLLPKRITFSSSDVEELKNFLLKLNDLLDECLMMAEQRSQSKTALFPSRSAFDLWNFIRVRCRLVSIKKSLQKFTGRLGTEQTLLSSSILILRPEAFSYFSEFKIRGIEDQVELIQRRVLEESGTKKGVVAIHGMGGSGKTALARKVFHSQEVQKHFEVRLWIDLSEAIDSEKKYYCILVEKSGSGYVKSPCQYGLDEVLSTLYSYIGNRRCLIILDSLWHGNEGIKGFVDEICEGFGGAVIVTCRFLDVAEGLVSKDGYLHRILPLKPETCRSIFIDSMKKKSDGDTYVIYFNGEIEKDIMYRCDGLPLAAKTLAEILHNESYPASIYSDQNRKKRVLYEINVHDRVSLSKAWYRVLGISGVEVEHTFYYKNQFLVMGTFRPSDVGKELGRYCHVELISMEEVDEKGRGLWSRLDD